MGERARPHRWWTPVRVVLAAFTVVFALGLVQKYPCGATDWSDEGVRYGAMCYSDVPYLYTGRGFAEQRWPYDAADGKYEVMEYPVGISYLAWTVSLGTDLLAGGPGDVVRAATEPGGLWGLPGMPREVNLYFLLTALALLACGLGATYFLAGASPGRPWDAMGFAAAPVLLLTALINWDLLAVLFVAGALWAWRRERWLLAGVMVGLGVAAKLYPLFLLGAFLIDAWRREDDEEEPPSWHQRLTPFGIASGAALMTWLLANAPAWLTGKAEWRHFWAFNDDRGADLGSIWLVLRDLGLDFGSDAINNVSLVLFGAACVGILWLGLTAPQRPRVAQTAFLVVAAFLAVNKVYSPQYVLWLLPLAALAVPRWRELLVWQAGEVLYFGAVWLKLGGWLDPSSGDVPVAYDLAILVRLLAQAFLVLVVVHEIRHPRALPDQVMTTSSNEVAVNRTRSST